MEWNSRFRRLKEKLENSDEKAAVVQFSNLFNSPHIKMTVQVRQQT